MAERRPQLSSPNDIDDIEKWSLDKATADGISVFWCVEVETRHKEVDIYVNDSPVRIISRPVIDMGNTGGNGLPVEDEIERFLNDRYPGAKVVEREYDDGCLELTVFTEILGKRCFSTVATTGSAPSGSSTGCRKIFWMRCSRLAIPSTTTNLNASKLPAVCGYEFEARKRLLDRTLRVDTNGKYRGLRRLMDWLQQFYKFF